MSENRCTLIVLFWHKSRNPSTTTSGTHAGPLSLSCIEVWMRMSWKHREICQSWLPSGGQGWMQSSHRVPESWLMTVFHCFGDSKCAFENRHGPSKRKCTHTPAQEKPQEAQTLEEFSSETISAIDHTYKLLHTPMPFHLLKWQFHKKDRMKVIFVSFPDYLQA